MGNQTQRFIIAVLLSLSCYGFTLWWYQSTESKQNIQSGSKPIAFVDSVDNEVHRRPVTRMIWQPISSGEALYPGETIRTSSDGEVRIQFNETHQFIDLEPDSMVVISQAKGTNEVALDLMDGNLFVGQSEKTSKGGGASTDDGAKLTLKSQSGNVDLSQVTASLSKTQGRDLNLQVLKGKARVENATGQVKEITSFNSNAVTILSPALDKTLFVMPDRGDSIVFRWKGFPERSQVFLLMGAQRKKLKEVAFSAAPTVSPLTPSSIEYTVFEGKYFWKLVARKPNGQEVGESPTYKLMVQNQYPPAAIYPEPEAHILTPKASVPLNLNLSWTIPEGSQNVYIEIAKDRVLKNKVLSKLLPDGQDSLSQFLSKGEYYWRLSSRTQGSTVLVSSPIYRFTIGEKSKIALPPMVITWQEPSTDRGPQTYVDKPTLHMTWKSEQRDQAKSWRFKVLSIPDQKDPLSPKEIEEAALVELTRSGPSSGSVKMVETSQMTAQMYLDRPGQYVALVEALDEGQGLLGRSGPKLVEIAPLPLLKAPQFLPEGDLKADSNGFLNLKWTSITGATQYRVHLRDGSGKDIAAQNYKSSGTTVKDLLPGVYNLEILAIDQYGREGNHSLPRKVLVPEMSSIKAPTLKGVRVK